MKIGKPCDPGNLEPLSIHNLGMFRNLTYSKPGRYSEPSQRFRMECFAKRVKAKIIFPKLSILDL